jgi:hypothetical protein
VFLRHGRGQHPHAAQASVTPVRVQLLAASAARHSLAGAHDRSFTEVLMLTTGPMKQQRQKAAPLRKQRLLKATKRTPLGLPNALSAHSPMLHARSCAGMTQLSRRTCVQRKATIRLTNQSRLRGAFPRDWSKTAMQAAVAFLLHTQADKASRRNRSSSSRAAPGAEAAARGAAAAPRTARASVAYAAWSARNTRISTSPCPAALLQGRSPQSPCAAWAPGAP